jgi:hypothetical protein
MFAGVINILGRKKFSGNELYSVFKYKNRIKIADEWELR